MTNKEVLRSYKETAAISDILWMNHTKGRHNTLKTHWKQNREMQ